MNRSPAHAYILAHDNRADALLRNLRVPSWSLRCAVAGRGAMAVNR